MGARFHVSVLSLPILHLTLIPKCLEFLAPEQTGFPIAFVGVVREVEANLGGQLLCAGWFHYGSKKLHNNWCND